MPDPIPADDLYARLGLPADADADQIERAWRALLKQHHPDVAGPESLEAAKRINVAHDWLSDAVRRARYDAARRLHLRWRPSEPGRPKAGGSSRRRAARRPPPPSPELVAIFGSVAVAVAIFLDRAAALTADDLDRLSVSEPFLFAPRVHHLLPAELATRLDAIDARLRTTLGPARWRDRRIAGSARSFGHALVLDAFLSLHLDDPEPLLEQMRRGWESAVGFPRYGPNTAEVAALVGRCGHATPEEASRLVRAWRRSGVGRDPWPAAAAEYDYAALEVSAALARRDAAAAVDSCLLVGRGRAAARRAFARSAHVVALKPIFEPSEFLAHHRPWGELLLSARSGGISPDAGGTAGGPRVRRASVDELPWRQAPAGRLSELRSERAPATVRPGSPPRRRRPAATAPAHGPRSGPAARRPRPG